MSAVTARKPSVLVVDDDRQLAEAIADGLCDRGFDAVACWTANDAISRVRKSGLDALVTDLRMPNIDGFTLLEASREAFPSRPVIVMTAFSAIDSAIESIRRGAFHYITKPFKVDELALFLGRALDRVNLENEAHRLALELREERSFAGIVSRSPAMQDILEVIARVSDSVFPVLLLGETGTGKGFLAHAIHNEGPRKDRPFVTINCATLPENLLESELFGHVKGAFSGAIKARTGLFVEADGGTLFLDEIGEMSPALQAKLLDVLERRVVRMVGSNREQSVDVRVIAATHRDLHMRVSEGLFRDDLLYRLAVIVLEVPPLRRRREDIPALVDLFFARARAEAPSSPARSVSSGVLERLINAAWPGNVRELKHAIQRAVLLARTETLDEADLPNSIVRSSESSSFDLGSDIVSLRAIQKRYAEWALDRLGGRKMAACEKLGIDPKTLNRLLAEDTS